MLALVCLHRGNPLIVSNLKWRPLALKLFLELNQRQSLVQVLFASIGIAGYLALESGVAESTSILHLL